MADQRVRAYYKAIEEQPVGEQLDASSQDVHNQASMGSSQPSMGEYVGQNAEDDSDHGEDCHRRRWLLGVEHASLDECNADGSE
eukprot:CAMPEP_0174382392 /NCGR_PEP_ID=MMETSP0811_2-20130205/124571_1 /TAXON_ID=73025 ORGANISM="Eutreptiella gymnastica-like, Strain CCMP1594" /NCGR_SAMPLE_ID=MMETSP0811_2 /ASSEMBLY_ACC=CAM_ASM_000667 /LENGTH=83 /DNA_ID=CAMNT_0015535695 /DNA_START=560 /DNA_END=808 /DNA_ORIENTATION=-